MRTLLEMDAKNYREGGTVGRRPSVRGIIFNGGRQNNLREAKSR